MSTTPDAPTGDLTPDDVTLEDFYSLLTALDHGAIHDSHALARMLGPNVEAKHVTHYIGIARDQGWVSRITRNASTNYRNELSNNPTHEPDFDLLRKKMAGAGRGNQTCPFCGEENITHRHHLPKCGETP